MTSLLFVAPQVGARNYGWYSRQISEVWEGTDPSDGNPCVILIDDQGIERSGFFMEPAKGLRRNRLVARALPTLAAISDLTVN